MRPTEVLFSTIHLCKIIIIIIFNSFVFADSSHSSSNKAYWCNVAYWELRQRVGRLYTVFDSTVDVFQVNVYCVHNDMSVLDPTGVPVTGCPPINLK